MRGNILIYQPGEREATIQPVTEPPEAPAIREVLCGPLELVPNFTTIAYGNRIVNCVAFCNEQGKMDNLKFNFAATLDWQRALIRRGQSLADQDGRMVDYLVGPIVVLFGDMEFMSVL